MSEVVIVEALRTPVGRRNGVLSGVHPADLLGAVQKEAVERSGVDPSLVGQVIGGCVSQIGEQSINVARTAWLTAGLPFTVPASTIDAQCGSAQQATALAAGLIASGKIEVAIGGGVESMSRIPLGSSASIPEFGNPTPDSYEDHYERTTQFEGAERIAEKYGIGRKDTDQFGLRSQQLAQAAWSEGRFDGQVVPIDAPVVDKERNPSGERQRVDRDQGLRETTLEGLEGLKPVAGPDGVHTAGSSSQISDGASAIVLASAEMAKELGLTARARIVDTCLVGSDPELMLTGPIPATKLILERNGMTIDDLDVIEVNEAFASVVLAWEQELKPDMSRVNPNGGAIALGHPVGGTGGILIAKALAELERTDKSIGLVTMCCGGGLGTGMLIERVQQ
jgi:acetyl-CoA C-acetyltransferase